MKVTFRSHKIDVNSGVNLYIIYNEQGEAISQDLDPWTAATIKGIFNRMGVKWEDEDI